jgi:hypothetical protein
VHSAPVVTTGNTITVQGTGLSQCGEDAVDDACRQVAINGGFSVHETVRVVLDSLAHVEFPHADAAAQFYEATRGTLSVKGKMFHVKHPHGSGARAPQTGMTAKNAAELALGTSAPSETLIVRQLGSIINDNDLYEAFRKIAPRVSSARVMKDCRGVTRGHGFVVFQEVYEATNALRHFRQTGSTINGKRVNADFAPPQSFEEGLEKEAVKKANEQQQGVKHQQALSGVNGDMWASYLSMFSEVAKQEKEQDDAHEAAAAAAAAARRAAEEAATSAQHSEEPDAKRQKIEDVGNSLTLAGMPPPVLSAGGFPGTAHDAAAMSFSVSLPRPMGPGGSLPPASLMGSQAVVRPALSLTLPLGPGGEASS